MRFFLIFFLLVCNSLSAMDLGKSELKIGSSEMEEVQKKILQCLNNKSDEIFDHLKIFKEKAPDYFSNSRQELSIRTKKIPTNTPVTLPLEDFFGEAEKLAKANLEGAARQLTWLGNTGRRNQACAGLVGILFGLAKGFYELYLYSEDETDYVKNSFDVAGNIASIGFGTYLIKQAWQNAGAKGEYGKAQAVLGLIQDQKKWVNQLAQQTNRIEEKIDLLKRNTQESSNSSMESTIDSITEE